MSNTAKEPKHVIPYSDYFVRYLLGSDHNSDLLKSFINAVLRDYGLKEVVSVCVKNPFNLNSTEMEKETILDIRAEVEDGREFNVEIQTYDQFFKLKSLFYWAQLYSRQLEGGENYGELTPTICINLVSFNIDREKGKRGKLHTSFIPKERETNEILTEHMDIHYVKLYKFMKREGFNSELEKWLAFFKYEGKEGGIMETIIKESPIFRKAHEQYEHFREDRELMAIYEARRKWRLEHNTQMNIARMEGLEEGRKESKEAVKKEKAARKREETARKEAEERVFREEAARKREEAARKEAEEWASKEAAERKALEEELKRLRSEAK